MKVVFEALPTSAGELAGSVQMNLTKPENTCALFLCALNIFTKDRQEGVAAINALKGPAALNAHEISFLTDRLRDKAYLPMAYFEGARPDNNYQPALPYTVLFYPDPRPQDLQAGYMRLYLRTAGADSPRAITLRQKDGNWYLWEYPGIVMGVRLPVKEDPWA
ncbi:MAG: DUF6935 domain-containing protein [Christensenellales bacterium]